MNLVEQGCACCACRSDTNDFLGKNLVGLSHQDAGILFADGGFVFAEGSAVSAAGDTIPGDTSTTATITVGGSVSGELEFAGDTDWFAIQLEAGQTVSISLSGSGANPLSDTYLTVFGSGGGLLAQNDDGGDGLNSLMRFTANTTGTYYIEAGAWNNQYAGEYTVSVSEAESLALFSLDQVADQLTSGYWGGNERAYTASTIFYEFVGLSAGEEALALAAMQYWASVADIKFQPTFNGSFPATLTFQNTDSGAYSESSVQYWDGAITSSIVNVSAAWYADYGSTLDSYTFQTYLHELGHALGLGHAGNYNGGASYANDALYLNDSWATTVMSYFDQEENTYFAQQGFNTVTIGTPMLADIVAIQNLYGARETRTGDNTYGFNAVGVQKVFDATVYPDIAYTIYDTGGYDTLDYSGFAADQVIDLRAESYSSVGGNTGNVAIARGVVIEDAIGGAGADRITGNDVTNVLWGNGGADILDGGILADVLWGGDGDDHLIGSAGNDTLRGEDGNDFLEGGASWDNLFGGQGNDVLTAGNGNDRLFGDAGDDILDGGAGVDLLRGGGGVDNLDGGSGDDIIKGEWANDTLIGGDGDDLILGGVGFDTIRGDAGNDLIYGEQGNDVIDGGDGNDRIYGASEDDELSGGAGADQLLGGAGDDRIAGGLGNDLLTGGAGNDVFVFGNFGDANVDMITDFQVGDKIGLDRTALFGTIEQLGAIDPGAFRYGTQALDADDRILYQSSTGKLFYDVDGVGGLDPVLFAQVAAGTALSAQSFEAFGEAAPPPINGFVDAIASVDPLYA